MQGKYKVYNLCSERLYDASLFEGKVCYNLFLNLLGGKYKFTFFTSFISEILAVLGHSCVCLSD
jgi:hypothetical protein